MAALRIGLSSDKHNKALFGRTGAPGFFGLLLWTADFPYFTCPFNLPLIWLVSALTGQETLVAVAGLWAGNV